MRYKLYYFLPKVSFLSLQSTYPYYQASDKEYESFVRHSRLLFSDLLLFGGKKLPELMRGMGRGVKEFKDAMEKPLDDLDKKDDKKD